MAPELAIVDMDDMRFSEDLHDYTSVEDVKNDEPAINQPEPDYDQVDPDNDPINVSKESNETAEEVEIDQ